MVTCRFGKVDADCNVSGIPEGRPLFLTVLVGNGCGALQQFLVQQSCVMRGCCIRSGVSGWLAAKQGFEPVNTVLDVPKAPYCHKQGSVVSHPACQR